MKNFDEANAKNCEPVSSSVKRPPKFTRIGRSYHLNIATAEDLSAVLDLDETHWVATSSPLPMLNLDEAFLRYVDVDADGRITCRDVKAAIRWFLDVLQDKSAQNEATNALALSAVNPYHPDGTRMIETTRRILHRQKSDDETITLEQVRALKNVFEANPVSEEGVVLPAAAATDAELQNFITSIVAVSGGTLHPSGAKGATETQLRSFMAAAEAYIKWYDRGILPDGETQSEIFPLGAATESAFNLMSSLRAKIDLYFAQCMAMELDSSLAGRLGLTASQLGETDFAAPASIAELLQKAPLTSPAPGRALNWDAPINPAHAKALDDFRIKVAEPLLGGSLDALTEENWLRLKPIFAPYEKWIAARPDGAITSIDISTLRRYIEPDLAAAARALIAESSKTALALDNIRMLEKLILYKSNLMLLINNFVSFPLLYDPERRAAFEMGTLIMDGRRFNLVVKVENRAQHAELARSSSIYTMYVEVQPKRDLPKYEVAVPVTSGGKGNLVLGKRGIFHDTCGNEYDAQVVQIIDNPVSLVEAVASPFQRLAKVLTGRIEAITAEAERKLDTAGSSAVDSVHDASREQARPPEPADRTSRTPTAGLLLGGGVAVAALGSSLAYITKTLADLPWYAIIIGLLAALAAVVIPTAVIAIIKLRRRDLSAILEGSGWAINERMRVTRRQSRFLTQRPHYPGGAIGLRSYRRLKILILIFSLLLAALLVITVSVRVSSNAPADRVESGVDNSPS